MKVRFENNLSKSIDLWLNRVFLRDGSYGTVTSGLSDWSGMDHSLFDLSSEAIYYGKQIWESHYDNFVYEGDLSAPSGYTTLLVCSGVYVDDVFTENGSGIHLDYKNGRVIFDTSQATTAVIQAEFCHKTVYIGNVDDDEDSELIKELYTEDLTIPSGMNRRAPAIFIDIGEITYSPLQLGGGGDIARVPVEFHIFAKNKDEKENILGLLRSQKRETFDVIDFEDAPQLFDVYGNKASTYEDYSVLQADYLYKNAFIKSCKTSFSTRFAGFSVGTVQYVLELRGI